MPFYEYVCTECGRPTEILQRLSDPPASECPTCHAQALIKQISAAGFRLKGGGWYETDFKSGDKRNLVDGDGADKSASASSDSKPDAKVEGKSQDGAAAPKSGEKAAEKPAQNGTDKASESKAEPKKSANSVTPAAKTTPAAT